MTTPIDTYINSCPENTRDALQNIRKTIQSVIPKYTETMAYGIPTFDLNGKHVVHYAAFTNHIGFFPTPSPIRAFAEKLMPYKTSRGTIQFPLTKPIPYDLIRDITEFRVKEVLSQTT